MTVQELYIILENIDGSDIVYLEGGQKKELVQVEVKKHLGSPRYVLLKSEEE